MAFKLCLLSFVLIPYSIDVCRCSPLDDELRGSESEREKTSIIVAELGNRLCSMGKFEDALRAYTDAIAQDPKGEFYILLGNCFVKMGQLDSALVNFEKAVEKDDKLSDTLKKGYSHALLSLALFEDEKFEEANQEMQTLSDEQLIAMGDDLLQKKKFKEALKYYTTATEMYPTIGECFEKRGLYYKQMGILPEAISDFKTAVQLKSSHMDNWIGLCEALIEAKNFVAAKEVYERIIFFEKAKDNDRVKEARSKIEAKGILDPL